MSVLLSVVIPVYNGVAFLQRITNSILSQDFRDFELILVNDGSTDNSLEVCQKICEQDDRVKVIDQKNCGVSGARNEGINQASGEYVIVCDQDDELCQGMFSKMMKMVIDFHPDVVRCNYQVLYDARTTESVIDYPYETLLDRQYILENILPYSLYVKAASDKAVSGHWTMMIRREMLRKNHIFYDMHSNKMADSRLIIDVLYAAESIVFVPELFYHWIKRSESQSHTYSSFFDDVKYVQRYYRQLLQGENYDFDSESKLRHDIEMIQGSTELVWLCLKGKKRNDEISRILSDDYTKSILAKIGIGHIEDVTWKDIFERAMNGEFISATKKTVQYFRTQRVKRVLKRLCDGLRRNETQLTKNN